jgi:tetratricopeptide (TPR) repeat protein
LTRAAALHASCGFAIRRARVASVLDRVAEAVEICRRGDDDRELGAALEQLAVCQTLGAGLEGAESTLAELDALVARASGMPDVAAGAEHARSLLAYGRSRYEEGAASLRHAIDLIAAVSPELGPVYWVTTPGMVLVDDLRCGRPRLYYEETLQHFRRVASPSAVAYLRCELAQSLRSAGDLAGAQTALERGLEEFRELGDDTGIGFALAALGNLARSSRDFEIGRELLEEALALRRRLGDHRAVRMTIAALAILAAHAGDIELARSRFAEMRADAAKSDDVAASGGTLISIASVELDFGRPELAAEAFRGAIRAMSSMLIARGIAWAHEGLGEALLAVGDPLGARAAWDAARPWFSKVGDERGLALVDALTAG